MQIRRHLLYLYFGLTSVAGVMVASPAIGMILILFTFGLAGIVPTLWLYTTLALPLLVIRSNDTKSVLLKCASAALVLYVAFVVPRQNTGAIDKTIQELTKDDFRKPSAIPPENLKFIVKALWRDDEKYKEPPLKTSECHRLCQRLLLNKSVKFVTVEATSNENKRVSIVTYRMEKRARCPDTFDGFERAITEMVLQTIDGNCLIASVGEDMRDGLQIEENSNIEIQERVFLKGYPDTKISRLLISEKRGDALTPVLRQTTVEYRRPNSFFSVGVYGGIFTTVSGVQIAGSLTTNNRLTDAQLLESEFGLSASPPKNADGKTIPDTTNLTPKHIEFETVTGILDDTNAAPFNKEVSYVLFGWIGDTISANYGKTLSEQETTLIDRILADRRVKMNSNIAWILSKLPDPHKERFNMVILRLCNTADSVGVSEMEAVIYGLVLGKLLPMLDQKFNSSSRVKEFRKHYCNS